MGIIKTGVDNQNDTLYGGTGDDTLFGGTNTGGPGWDDDLLCGGDGSDTYLVDSMALDYERINDSGGQADTLVIRDPDSAVSHLYAYRAGLNKNDLVIDVNSKFIERLNVRLEGHFDAAGTQRIEFLKMETTGLTYSIQTGVTGSADNDLIVGTNTADSMVGGAGDDLMFGSYGGDTLIGGTGADYIHGGNEYSWSDLGNDSLVGGSGADTIVGGYGSDTIDGGSENDLLSYREHDGGVYANLSDTGYSSTWTGYVAPGTVYKGETQIDKLNSVEFFIGSKSDDTFVLGRAGSSTYVIPSWGNDCIQGGSSGSAAWAIVSYSDGEGPYGGVIVNLGETSLTVQLPNQNAWTVQQHQAHDGGGGWDYFVLDNRALGIEGSQVADYIRGRDGSSDFIIGLGGDDTIDGGTGLDTVSYNSSFVKSPSVGVVVNLSSAAITVNVAGVSVKVDAGHARDSWANFDTLYSIENVAGSRFNDYILGSAADNASLDGGNGHDTIDGGSGNDQLFGGSGNDQLLGGVGNDQLDGGSGNDVLTGGAGLDYFVFSTAPNASSNLDRIQDFNAAEDTILLENGIMSGLTTTGYLSSAAFYAAAGATQALDTSDRIIYNTTTGDLYYDADGSGTASAAVKFAVLTKVGTAAVTNLDFLVI